nr:acyltransferase family protein [Leucobacter chromiireducens]
MARTAVPSDARPKRGPRTPRPTRTDIQALRAIAVGLVILNHLWPDRLPGGYVGVDVFFVISGFLISTHLISQLMNTGRIAFAEFTARRARRLLPAALLVSLAALAGALLWLPAERWPRIANETFAATAYVENWFLAASAVDYSAQSEAATTVQHYWSLSVEEQFYLLWPLTLLGLTMLLGRRARTLAPAPQPAPAFPRVGLLLAVSLLGVLSFAFAVWLTGTERSLAYFHTGTRVWEFMVGAAIALAAPAWARWLSRDGAGVTLVRGVAHWLAFGLIGWSALTFSDTTAFPGPWAALPVAGTALILATGDRAPRWSPLVALRWRPAQWAGDASYSLYLWHWPLIVLAPAVVSRELQLQDRVAILALTIVLAALTKRYVEDPGRTRLFRGARPRRTLWATAASVVVVALLAGGVHVAAQQVTAQAARAAAEFERSGCFGAGALAPEAALDSPTDCGDPFGAAKLAPRGDDNAPWYSPPECALAEQQILAEGQPSLVECDFSAARSDTAGSGTEAPLVWLVGDSHAEHWKAAVYDVARGNGWRVNSSMQGGCPIVDVDRVAFRGVPDANPAKATACRSWSAEVTERIRASDPALILVSTFTAQETVDDGSGRPQAEQVADASARRFAQWRETGANVVVVRDVPYAEARLGPDCVELDLARAAACTAPASEVLPPDAVADAAAASPDPRVAAIDLSDRFCRADTCYGVIGGVPVFFDADHLARSYARSLAPALATELARATGWAVASPRPELN